MQTTPPAAINDDQLNIYLQTLDVYFSKNPASINEFFSNKCMLSTYYEADNERERNQDKWDRVLKS